jgi:hypothetical protein
MKITFLILSSLLFDPATQLLAVQIPIASYTHSGSDGGFYVDSGGELTDGVDATIAWGTGISIGPGDVGPLVGWQGNNPTITFQFVTPVNIGSVEVWFADSNGHAGVAMLSAVTLSNTGDFHKVFPCSIPLATAQPCLSRSAGSLFSRTT